ncbi:MAG: hypothetical protein KAV87_23375 [Desulfobacteraceae bacterium]|jgi:hypothetical protein|nr:hypothetical protein [Desulfobacteraceae bacterium]
MTMFSFLDIENAFMYVSSAMYGMNSAVVCKDTGKILYRSDMAGIDEIEDEDHLDWEQCIEIPHKNDLDLGRNLAFEFVEEYLPDDYERVLKMFRRRGAYSRYKALLERRGLLKEWYDIENSREERALRKWCKENEIELDG